MREINNKTVVIDFDPSWRDNNDGNGRKLIEVNAFSCNTENSDCDYQNQYCVDHSKYTREMLQDGKTPALKETDLDQGDFECRLIEFTFFHRERFLGSKISYLLVFRT